MAESRDVLTIVNQDGASPLVLVCEHASNWIPPEYSDLGLPEDELQRHIAYDIGAAAVARQLSVALDAPLFLAGVSRLVIDLNRPPGAPTSIPAISETTIVPGNANLSGSERERRAERFFHPFHTPLADFLDRRAASGQPTLLLGVHSFTPVFKGVTRPMHAGVLYRRSKTFGDALLAALAEPDLVLAANAPYSIDDEGDYMVPVHGEARGLEAVLIEMRQDLIADERGQTLWAGRLMRALRHCLNSRHPA